MSMKYSSVRQERQKSSKLQKKNVSLQIYSEAEFIAKLIAKHNKKPLKFLKNVRLIT